MHYELCDIPLVDHQIIVPFQNREYPQGIVVIHYECSYWYTANIL